MGKSQKVKGKRFESKVGNLLHEFFLENHNRYRDMYEETGIKPTRSFSSGADIKEHGDIMLGLLRQIFPFSIECKHHKDLNLTLQNILGGSKQKLFAIWENQVLPKSQEQNLKPLLIFKANLTNIFVMCRLQDVKIENINKKVLLGELAILTLEDFLNNYIREENR